MMTATEENWTREPNHEQYGEETMPIEKQNGHLPTRPREKPVQTGNPRKTAIAAGTRSQLMLANADHLKRPTKPPPRRLA